MIMKLRFLNLLYIEDHIKTKDNYAKTFKLMFNNVFTAINYKEAITKYSHNQIDIVLVDIELNDEKNGFDIASKIRETNQDIPIIILSSHEDTEFVQKAINSNINGYIIKPLDLDKFTNITTSFLKKLENKNVIKFSRFFYNFDTCELYDINKEKIQLSKNEHRLMQIFLKNKHKILNREQLEYHVWEHPISSDSTLKNLIATLRKKIGKDMIINESKIGWRLKI